MSESVPSESRSSASYATASASSVVDSPSALAHGATSVSLNRLKRKSSASSMHQDSSGAVEQSTSIEGETSPTTAAESESESSSSIMNGMLAPSDAFFLHLQKKARTAVNQYQICVSPFHRFLSTDGDSVSTIFHMLNWRDIAHLYSTCQFWREYITHPRHSLSPPVASLAPSTSYDIERAPSTHLKTLIVTLRVYQLLQRAYWIRFHLRALAISHDDRFPNPNSPLLLDLSGLSMFSMLANCELNIPPTLSTNQEALNALAYSSSLQELIIYSDLAVDSVRQLSFRPLTNLRQLKRFSLEAQQDFNCTKTQVLELIEIQSLTDLRCGSFLTHYAESDHGRSRKQFITETIGQMCKLPKLQRLYMEYDEVLVDCWLHLTNCQALTELTTDQDLADSWSHLSRLRFSLKMFEFLPFDDAKSIPFPQQLVSALMQCTFLEALTFTYVEITDREWRQIFENLSILKELELRRCKIDSLNSFASAKSLCKFRALELENFDGKYFQWAHELPAMDNLISLEIGEDWVHVFVKSEWNSKTDSAKLRSTLVDCCIKIIASKMPKLKAHAIKFD